MKKIREQTAVRRRIWKTAAFCLFSAVLIGAAQAQQGTISGTVDAPAANSPLPGLKVVVVDPKSERVVEQKAAENGRYQIAVSPGSYEIFACDPALEYEPYSRKAEVKAGSSQTKDIHLIKKPLSVPAEGGTARANVAVCVRHLESTCAAERTTDAKGEVVIPGPESHFEIFERGEHPCE